MELGAWVYSNDCQSGIPEKNINLEPLPAKKNAGLLFSGYIQIPESGDWTFHCKATGGVILKIHNKLVIDGDYKYAGTEISTTVKLDKGIHPYRFYYKTSTNKPALSLQWGGPNITKSLIPADAFLCRKVIGIQGGTRGKEKLD